MPDARPQAARHLLTAAPFNNRSFRRNSTTRLAPLLLRVDVYGTLRLVVSRPRPYRHLLQRSRCAKPYVSWSNARLRSNCWRRRTACHFAVATTPNRSKLVYKRPSVRDGQLPVEYAGACWPSGIHSLPLPSGLTATYLPKPFWRREHDTTADG